MFAVRHCIKHIAEIIADEFKCLLRKIYLAFVDFRSHVGDDNEIIMFLLGR